VVGLVVGSFDEFAILESGAGADERDEGGVRRLLRGSNWPVVAWPADPWRGAPILAGPAGLMAEADWSL